MNSVQAHAPIAAPATARIGLLRQLREDCACVFDRDPAARNKAEVLLLYPGVHAIALHRIAHAWWRHGFKFMARALAYFARWWTSIEIHPAAQIGRRFFIDHGCGVVVGETAIIGDDVTLYHGVTLGGTSWNPGKRHPTIGDGVVVGAGAKVLGNITVGAQARVAANSVVIDDVPAGMTVVGIPGRIVKPREVRRVRAGMIDLDHHEVPDPVGRALGCLLDRVEFLEARLTEQRAGTSASRIAQPHIDAPVHCAECSDDFSDTCSPTKEERHADA